MESALSAYALDRLKRRDKTEAAKNKQRIQIRNRFRTLISRLFMCVFFSLLVSINGLNHANNAIIWII